MSNTLFLDQLLDGVEVEWLPLRELCQILNGFAFKSSEYSDTGIRIIRISDVQKGKVSDKDLKFYPEETAQEIQRYLLRENDLVMSLTGNVGRVAMLSHNDLPAALNQRVACIRANSHSTLTRYLFHFFDQDSFENEAMSNATGGGQKNMSTRWLSSYAIPIPCPSNPKKSLEIQGEIVRILDTFTELTAELTARKKQYNYYRDQLLSFEDGDVEWKTLGDENLFEVGSGGTPSKAKVEYWDGGSIPWLKSESCNNQSVYAANNFITQLGLAKSSAKLLQENTTLIALVGATIFKTAFLPFQAATNQNIASIKSRDPKAIDDKFVFYYLTNMYESLKSEMRNYGMLNLTTLRQFKIPIPSTAEQARIVSILDKFDALTNSISEGLPREIELRQQQYEYYRDLLLSFPKPEEAAV
ncbi:MAG: restriction endonuclease subunit S [Planctomycetaceae bacterium]